MNQVSLVGRLAQDPKLTHGEDKARAFFTVAVERRSSDETVDWVPVVVFGAQAEAVADHVGKGHLVAVTGRLRSSSFEADGRVQYRLEVIGERVDFLARPRAHDDADGGRAA